MMEIKEDVQDMSVKFQQEWAELRRHYGKNIVLEDLYTAARLKDERWEAQSAPDKAERAEATKDVMRCDFTFKVFNALKRLKSVSAVRRDVFFAEYYYNHIEAFGQLMGDVPRTLKRQGEWWLTELRRIALGGKVSGEALTILSYAAAKHLKNGFDDADIKYPIIRINGEAEKAAAVIEKTIGNPFFDINEPKKSGDEPFDISAWAENLGRHIELIFDGEAVAELTESMARLSGVPVDNPKGVELWIRACGRAVKDTAAELPADWVRKNHDESYVGLPSRCLDLKMRNSIAGILVGAKLLAKTLSDYRDLTFYDAFGVLPDDFEDWLVKTQRTDR